MVYGRACLPGLQTATSSLCPRMDLLCAHEQREHSQVSLPSLIWTPALPNLSPTLTTSLNFNYLPTGPISKCCHMGRYGFDIGIGVGGDISPLHHPLACLIKLNRSEEPPNTPSSLYQELQTEGGSFMEKKKNLWPPPGHSSLIYTLFVYRCWFSSIFIQPNLSPARLLSTLLCQALCPEG